MGYCYISGSKESGRWVFDKCDGRKTDYCGNTDRNKNCSSYCKNYKLALMLVKEWDRLNKE